MRRGFFSLTYCPSLFIIVFHYWFIGCDASNPKQPGKGNSKGNIQNDNSSTTTTSSLSSLSSSFLGPVSRTFGQMVQFGYGTLDACTKREDRMKEYLKAEQLFFDQESLDIKFPDKEDDEDDNDKEEDDRADDSGFKIIKGGEEIGKGEHKKDSDGNNIDEKRAKKGKDEEVSKRCPSSPFPEIGEQSHELIKLITLLLENAADLSSVNSHLKPITVDCVTTPFLFKYENDHNTADTSIIYGNGGKRGELNEKKFVIYIVRPVIYPEDLSSPDRMFKYLDVANLLLPVFLNSLGSYPKKQIILAGVEDAGPIALLLAWRALKDHPFLKVCSGPLQNNQLNQLSVFMFQSGYVVTPKRAERCPLGQRNILRFYKDDELTSRDFGAVGNHMRMANSYVQPGNMFNDITIKNYVSYPNDLWEPAWSKSGSEAKAIASRKLTSIHGITKYFLMEAAQVFHRHAVDLVLVDQNSCALLLARRLGDCILPSQTGIIALNSVPFKEHSKEMSATSSTMEYPISVQCRVDQGSSPLRDVWRKVTCELVSNDVNHAPVHISFSQFRVRVVPLGAETINSSNPDISPSVKGKNISQIDQHVVNKQNEEVHFQSPTPATSTSLSTTPTVISTKGNTKLEGNIRDMDHQLLKWKTCLEDVFKLTTNLQIFSPDNKQPLFLDLHPNSQDDLLNKKPRQCYFENVTNVSLLMNAYMDHRKLFYRLLNSVIQSTNKPPSCEGLMQPSYVDDPGNAEVWLTAFKEFLSQLPMDSAADQNRSGIVNTSRFKMTTLSWPSKYPFPGSFKRVITQLKKCTQNLLASQAYDCEHPATLFAGINQTQQSYCPAVCMQERNSVGCNRIFSCGGDLFLSVHGDGRLGSYANPTRTMYKSALPCDQSLGYTFHFMLEDKKPAKQSLLNYIPGSVVNNMYGTIYLNPTAGDELLEGVDDGSSSSSLK